MNLVAAQSFYCKLHCPRVILFALQIARVATYFWQRNYPSLFRATEAR